MKRLLPNRSVGESSREARRVNRSRLTQTGAMGARLRRGVEVLGMSHAENALVGYGFWGSANDKRRTVDEGTTNILGCTVAAFKFGIEHPILFPQLAGPGVLRCLRSG